MIEIIRDPIQMDSIAIVWNELADRSKNPLLRYEWFAACAQAYCQADRLRVAINTSTGNVTAIAPLVLTQHHRLSGYEVLGASALGEPSGLICRDDESLKELVAGIIKMKRPVLLSKLRSESPEVAMLRRLNLKGSCIIFRDGQGSPYLPISTAWTEFVAGMSSRHRYDLRRAQKRAEEFGDVQFEIVRPDPDTLDPYLNEIYHVEAAGWKGREGTAILFDRQLKGFFDAYSKEASRSGALRLCFLRIAGKTAAVVLAVEYYDRFWVLKIGYDETFARCSPGMLLLHETIRHGFAQGLEAYEFLGSDAPWIHIWTKQQHSYVTARIYPLSILGQCKLGIDAAFALSGKALKIAGK